MRLFVKAVDGVGDIVGGRRMVTYDRSISMEELYVSQYLFKSINYSLYSIFNISYQFIFSGKRKSYAHIVANL